MMNEPKENICRIEVGHLTIRASKTSDGKPSLVLSMPSIQRPNEYAVLRIDSNTKLFAIKTCISVLLEAE